MRNRPMAVVSGRLISRFDLIERGPQFGDNLVVIFVQPLRGLQLLPQALRARRAFRGSVGHFVCRPR